MHCSGGALDCFCFFAAVTAVSCVSIQFKKLTESLSPLQIRLGSIAAIGMIDIYWVDPPDITRYLVNWSDGLCQTNWVPSLLCSTSEAKQQWHSRLFFMAANTAVTKGTPHVKKNVFFWALPKLPPPPLLSGNLYIFFGRHKGIYKVYFLIRARFYQCAPHLPLFWSNSNCGLFLS